jgi:hypothetical protein
LRRAIERFEDLLQLKWKLQFRFLIAELRATAASSWMSWFEQSLRLNRQNIAMIAFDCSESENNKTGNDRENRENSAKI